MQVEPLHLLYLYYTLVWDPSTCSFALVVHRQLQAQVQFRAHYRREPMSVYNGMCVDIRQT
jgi:hypothetical protein